LAPGEIHVWTAALKADGDTARWWALLSTDERHRAARLQRADARGVFVETRGRLRGLLARYIDVAPQELRFRLGPHGKPALTAPKVPLEFSVSHTEGRALFAVARSQPVGVDLERVREIDRPARRAAQFFAPLEQEAFATLPPSQRPTAFLTCWVRKEAYVKARGLGFALPPDRFAVSVSPAVPPRLLVDAWHPDAPHHWQLWDVRCARAYVAALAARGEVTSVRVRQLHH
jgi:4'-phosphopantetheinyl transferase